VKRFWTGTWGAALLLSPALAAAEPGTVFVETPLRAAPSITAETLGTLGPDTAVSVEESRGLWLRVSPAGGGDSRGWVRRFDVRTGAPEERESAAGALGGLGRLFSGGGQQEEQVTATIGVRGLDAADLQGARPDPAALQVMERYRASADEAARLAREAGLASRQVAYPETPSAEAPADGGGDSGAFGFGGF
jgi:hypothetical protein